MCEKGIQQLLQVQGFRMITTMCVESKHRKKIARSDVTLKNLKIYAKVAIFCKQKQGSFRHFYHFFCLQMALKFFLWVIYM